MEELDQYLTEKLKNLSLDYGVGPDEIEKVFGIRIPQRCRFYIYEGRQNQRQCAKLSCSGSLFCKDHLKRKNIRTLPIFNKIPRKVLYVEKNDQGKYEFPERHLVFDPDQRKFTGKMKNGKIVDLNKDDEDYLINENMYGVLQVQEFS